jgi:hypothetical protein
MNTDHATAADYLRIGIELGLVEPQQARDWADAIIRESEAPPAEIIEVSWSHDVGALIRSLFTAPGEGNRALAGRWLLHDLATVLGEGDDDGLVEVVRGCLAVCVASGLDEDTWHRFDAVDDELSLARQGVFGSVEACREALVSLLAEYPAAPEIGAAAPRSVD